MSKWVWDAAAGKWVIVSVTGASSITTLPMDEHERAAVAPRPVGFVHPPAPKRRRRRPRAEG